MGLSRQNPRSQAGPGLGGDVPNLRPKREIRLKLNNFGTHKSLNLSYSIQNYTRKRGEDYKTWNDNEPNFCFESS